MNFAEKSKLLRKERNLSQVKLAEALNLSKACISMIEIGKNEPTANTLIRYADFFECSIDFLLDREDDFGIINIPLKQSKTAELTPDGQEFLSLYEQLPADLQRRAMQFLKNLVAISEDELNLRRKSK